MLFDVDAITLEIGSRDHFWTYIMCNIFFSFCKVDIKTS